jgi:hypothetical protein
MVDAYVDRDHILKGKGGGSGKGPDNGAGGKNHAITRSEFEQLNPAQQRAVLKEKEVVDG